MSNNWKTYTLGDLGTYINGRAFKPEEWKTKGLPIIRIQNLNDKEAVFNYSDEEHEERHKVRRGDLLVAWSASLGAYVWDGDDAWLNQHIFKVIANEKLIEKEFLFFTLKKAINELYAKSHGTGMVHVTKPVFESHEVTIPTDRKVQKDLVSTFNNYFPIIDASIKSIKTSKTLIQKFRQSILSTSITGRLTKEWREINQGNSYVKPKDYSHTKKPNFLFGIDHFQLYDLPDNWTWKSFWEIASIKSNLVKPTEYPDHILIAPDNIERNTGVLLEKRLVKEIKPISAKHLFNPGYIVYSKIRPYLNKLTLVDFEGLCSADMYPIDTTLDIRYLRLFMLSNFFLSAASNIGDRTLLPKINQEELNSIPVAVPPMDEQKEIAIRANTILEIADKVEQHIKIAITKTEKISQAVLAKAFRGELTN